MAEHQYITVDDLNSSHEMDRAERQRGRIADLCEVENGNNNACYRYDGDRHHEQHTDHGRCAARHQVVELIAQALT